MRSWGSIGLIYILVSSHTHWDMSSSALGIRGSAVNQGSEIESLEKSTNHKYTDPNLGLG